MKYGRAVAAMLVILMGLTGCTKASPAGRNDHPNASDVPDVAMEENVIICDAVPQEYCEPAEHAGTLQRFYYRTRNYDKDESEMERKPEVFRFGNPYEPDTNCVYAIGPGEKHNAEGRLRYIYNILPAFSARINATMRMEL